MKQMNLQGMICLLKIPLDRCGNVFQKLQCQKVGLFSAHITSIWKYKKIKEGTKMRLKNVTDVS